MQNKDLEYLLEKKIVLFEEESDGSTDANSRASHVESSSPKPSVDRLEID
jgi:hypothetical protein